MAYLLKSAKSYDNELKRLPLTEVEITEAIQNVISNPMRYPWECGALGFYIGKLKDTIPEYRILYYFEQCPKFVIEDAAHCNRHTNPKYSQPALCENNGSGSNGGECKGLIALIAIDKRENMRRRYKAEKRLKFSKVENAINKTI